MVDVTEQTTKPFKIFADFVNLSPEKYEIQAQISGITLERIYIW